MGYDLSYAKQSYEKNKFNFKTPTSECGAGSSHLKFVIETLISCYSKEEVVNVLKDL